MFGKPYIIIDWKRVVSLFHAIFEPALFEVALSGVCIWACVGRVCVSVGG